MLLHVSVWLRPFPPTSTYRRRRRPSWRRVCADDGTSLVNIETYTTHSQANQPGQTLIISPRISRNISSSRLAKPRVVCPWEVTFMHFAMQPRPPSLRSALWRLSPVLHAQFARPRSLRRSRESAAARIDGETLDLRRLQRWLWCAVRSLFYSAATSCNICCCTNRGGLYKRQNNIWFGFCAADSIKANTLHKCFLNTANLSLFQAVSRKTYFLF